MWNTNSIWFDITIVTLLFLLGNIFLGHFEERSPKWRKLVKYIITLVIFLSISMFFGRIAAFIILTACLVPVLYIHGVLLPRKGINGWTGEPKAKYYAFRGWSTNIFDRTK
jgi:predicted membrane protein